MICNDDYLLVIDDDDSHGEVAVIDKVMEKPMLMVLVMKTKEH